MIHGIESKLISGLCREASTERDMLGESGIWEKLMNWKIFMADLVKESQKFATEYSGSEKWRNLIKTYGEQDKLSRDMVEAVIDKITAYNDGQEPLTGTL